MNDNVSVFELAKEAIWFHRNVKSVSNLRIYMKHHSDND